MFPLKRLVRHLGKARSPMSNLKPALADPVNGLQLVDNLRSRGLPIKQANLFNDSILKVLDHLPRASSVSLAFSCRMSLLKHTTLRFGSAAMSSFSTSQHKLVPCVETALINYLREQGLTSEEAKKITAAVMVLHDSLETEMRSLLQNGEIHKVNEAQDSIIDQHKREMDYQQKQYELMFERDMRTVWKMLDLKMKDGLTDIEEMVIEGRLKSISLLDAKIKQTSKMTVFTLGTIVTAGLAIFSIFK